MFILESPIEENNHKRNYFEGKELTVRIQYSVQVGQNGLIHHEKQLRRFAKTEVDAMVIRIYYFGLQ